MIEVEAAIKKELGHTKNLIFSVHTETSSTTNVTITVPYLFVDTLYKEAIHLEQGSFQAYGFQTGKVPVAYIEKNFKSTLIDHLKEFLFNFFVLSFLYKELHKRQIPYVGTPRLKEITVDPNKGALYLFELNIFPALDLKEWKYYPFKAPQRKNYKDLDRQVTSFIKEEKENLKAYNEKDGIAIGDWVGFSVTPTTTDHKPLFEHKEELWLHIGEEEADSPFHDLFLKKQLRDTFYTTNQALQNHFSSQINAKYTYLITINHVVTNKFFCLDLFKKQFRLKTNKDLHEKLIEVFSYRNDLSQRRSMAEESLKLLLTKHRFTVPSYLVLRQQKELLDVIQQNPDYQVYRTQPDFKKSVQALAEKTVKEAIILDQVAFKESLSANDDDIAMYLNLSLRPRSKEFIYFDPIETKMHNEEIPLSAEYVRHQCLREKTLNHIIYHLTK